MMSDRDRSRVVPPFLQAAADALLPLLHEMHHHLLQQQIPGHFHQAHCQPPVCEPRAFLPAFNQVCSITLLWLFNW
jgi:hypothetical protein